MRLALFLLPLALAAPTHQTLDLSAANAPAAADHISEYFNILAEKTQRYGVLGAAPACDASRAVLPTAPSLPAPGAPVLKHVAIGRGTQNYTCSALNATASPVPSGAVATLFDATCLSSLHPTLLAALSRLSISYRPTPIPFSGSQGDGSNSGFGGGAALPRLGPSALRVSGVHYFTAAGVPFFDLGLAGGGSVGVGLNASVPAPPDAGRGLGGEKAVGWLRLLASEAKSGDMGGQGGRAAAEGGLEEVYRVATVGGTAPETCEGMPEAFEVEYVAQYWFLGTN